MKAPDVFCIKNNPDATINFFNEIINIRLEYVCDIILFIDISQVNYVGADALMYLLAIIRDTKYYKQIRIRFQGNFPMNNDIKQRFIDSGFLSYVHTEKMDIEPHANNIQIRIGTINDPKIAGTVCSFVQDTCKLTKKETIPLYNILIELMGNTNQHAYKGARDNSLLNNWYLYAEENESDISFVFLDTGLGIPATVRKNFGEMLKEKISISYSDADYIYSALQGEYRTETKLRHRGKGLPQISDCCRSGIFNNVSIYAGSGNCYIRGDNEFCKRNLSASMKGTLFTWSINKRRHKT